MKTTTVKTSELTGAQLDWAVAHAGREWEQAHKLFPTMTLDPRFKGVFICEQDGKPVCFLEPNNTMRQDPQYFMPSTNWAQGGPIIEREEITVGPAAPYGCTEYKFHANILLESGIHAGSICHARGDTPLIAAMRAFVASKLGDEVEVPA